MAEHRSERTRILSDFKAGPAKREALRKCNEEFWIFSDVKCAAKSRYSRFALRRQVAAQAPGRSIPRRRFRPRRHPVPGWRPGFLLYGTLNRRRKLVDR